MYLGQIVEIAGKHDDFRRAGPSLHPGAARLGTVAAQGQQAIPDDQGRRAKPGKPPPGCRFHTRCPMVQDICRATPPMLAPLPPGHDVACHFAEDIRKLDRPSENPMANRPNIVLVCADQQRMDSLACYGNRFISSPGTDAMAANGMVFDRGIHALAGLHAGARHHVDGRLSPCPRRDRQSLRRRQCLRDACNGQGDRIRPAAVRPVT